MAIYFQAHVLALAKHFHSIPLAGRLFDLMRPAETFHIFPWVPAGPVKPSDIRSFGDSVHGKVSSFDDQNVSRAPFDDLSFDGFGPDLIFARKMNENPAIARIVLA